MFFYVETVEETPPPLYPPPVNPGASYLFLDNASDDPLIILDEQGNLVEFYV
jgi:hypothetical protein